jgi:gluconolactonase
MWQPNERYPDPAVRVLDPSFNQYRLSLASVERLYTGCRWAEGPVYFGDGRYLLWSDIPNNRVLRWDEETGAVSVFRKPSNNANGHTRDRRGRLIACEHDARRIVRFEYDGAITVLADSYNGKPLNSPNDVVVKSDGSVWFSDPVFGILGYYEGHKAPSENKPAIYRLDPATGKLTMMADDIPGPNGLAFSPDEKKLYVVASRAEPHRTIVSYDLSADGMNMSGGKVLIDAGPGGSPDGFRVDVDGNLWCGWGMGNTELDGVRIFNKDGKPIGHIDLPERCANLCFGSRHRNRLFMAASHSLYALYVNTQGVAGG